jgi:voltage-gated potassium channel
MASPPVPDPIPPQASQRVGLYRRSVSIFLGTLVLFMVAMPFAQYLADPGLVEGPLVAMVLICGMLAVGGRRKSLVLAVGLALPALAARWLWHYWPTPLLHGLFLGLGTLLFLQVTVQLLRFIVRARDVDAEVLAAGVATFLVLGQMWAMLYLLVSFFEPNAFALPASVVSSKGFDGFNAFYFSFVTLTSTGYGDISPTAPVTRMLAVLEAVTGVLYLSVLIARLVTLYTGRQA